MSSKKRRRTTGSPPVEQCNFQLSSAERHLCFDRFLALYNKKSMCDVVLRVHPPVADSSESGDHDSFTRNASSSASFTASASASASASAGAASTAIASGASGPIADAEPSQQPTDFEAHKCVLAGYPSFLSAMLEAGMRESQQTVIDLHDTDPAHFKLLLDYIYGAPIQIPSTDVIQVLGLSSRYQVAGLREKACMALEEGLDARNCPTVLSAADEYMCADLRSKAFSMVVGNFALASNTASFGELSIDVLREVLASDRIVDCDEAIVLEAVQKWVATAPETRTQQADEVLSLVRFPLMNTTYLSEVVKKLEIMQSPGGQALLSEAFEHIALVHSVRDCPGLETQRATPRRRTCAFEDETTLTGHTDAVSAMTVYHNKLISGSWDSTIRVWNMEHGGGLERTISHHSGPVLALAMCSGNLISASGDCTLMVWDPENWSLVRSLDDHSDVVNCVCQFEDRLVSGSDDGTIKLWSTTSWGCEVTLHSASEEQPCGVLCLEVCGTQLISGSAADGVPATIKIWNTSSWTCERVIEAHDDSIWALQVCASSDGDKLFSASVDQTIQVWDCSTWTSEQTLTDHDGPVYALTCFEGKVISGSDDEKIIVWAYDAAEQEGTWKPERTLPTSGIWSLAHFNDRLVSGLANHAINVFK